MAGILNHSSPIAPRIAYNAKEEAIRRPLIAPEYQSQIQKTIDELTKLGKTRNTINNVRQRLNQLSKLADLKEPEAIKLALGKAPLANSSKQSHVFAYDCFCKANSLNWIKPHYSIEEPTPIIPTTENVTKIISASTRRYTTIFTIMAETGIEDEELHQLKRKNIDQEQAIISLSGTKGHASGSYKLKPQTAEMLRDYLARNPQEQPFPTPKSMRTMWIRARNKVADNQKQPQLKNIPLKSLRNYSGAKLYYSRPDPILVMRHLRHKKLDTTMHYLRAIVLDGEEEYICKTATNTKEATELIEKGFQYVNTMDGIALYRKHK